MDDLRSRFLGVGLGILLIFSYFLPFIPDGLKNIFALMGVVLFVGYILTPQLMVLPNLLVEKKYCQSCKRIEGITETHNKKIQEIKESIPEKNFRFIVYEKVVIIDEHGKGWVNQFFELLNDGENYLQHFPIEFSAVNVRFKKTLSELARDNEFKVESQDDHNIRWEAIRDDEETKKIHVVFDQRLNPGDTRKYSVRYQIDRLYNTNPPGETDSSSFTPIHNYVNLKIKVKFLPKYKYSNPRYCVESPGGILSIQNADHLKFIRTSREALLSRLLKNIRGCITSI